MSTLNSIAENIAYKLGQQFNYTLRESIKLTVLDYRAKILRDTKERERLSELHFSQDLPISFEIMDILELTNTIPDCGELQGCVDTEVAVSKKGIPLPIRFKSSSAPYIYVGSPLGTKAFIYVTLPRFHYVKNLKYQKDVIYYTIINNRIVILNNLNPCDVTFINETICKVLVKGIFENPKEVYNLCELDKPVDDMPFPISKDMSLHISNGIIKGEYPLVPKSGEVVNINSKENDKNS